MITFKAMCLLPALVLGADADWERGLWNDPAFKARFIESYLAETDIEPRIATADERKQLVKIFDLIAANKKDEAADLLVKSQTKTSNAVFDFTLGNIYFEKEQLAEAQASYLVAVEKYAKFRRAWRNLASIHLKQGEHKKALTALARVIELGGGDAIAYTQMGVAYLALENNLSAESAFRMAILLDPFNDNLKMGLARSLFKQDRFADAAALCGQMIEADPNKPELWLLQANAYIGMNKPMRAAENYEMVDRLGKSTVDSLSMLGDIYVNEELFDLAVRSYSRSMDMKPPPKPDRALRAAKVMTARGATTETRALLERMAAVYGDQLKPEERKEILKLRARMAVAEGAGDEEARVLEEIVQLDPIDGDALILLGLHHARASRPEKAIFYYERAASIQKFEADAKVRHAQLLVGQGKYNDALPLLRSAQQASPRENVQRYLEQVERVAKARQ